MGARSLEQLKLDAKNAGWPWPIDHPNDERALLEGCYLDFEAAEKVRYFYESLLQVPHPKTRKMQPFKLLEWWYRDVLAPLFGWKRPDGRRRFTKGFITTAKKSGKSTVLAGLPLYMMLCDDEEEAECYAAATARDQASLIYQKTSRAVRDSPHLSSVLKRIDSRKRIAYHAKSSYFEAISSDADSAEGKNPHLLLADELHVWKDRSYFEALMYADIARPQPLFLMITTAGDNELSAGFEEYQFACDLLNPDNEFYSQSHFAIIQEAQKDRDWKDPDGWAEANPSILEGVGDVETLKTKAEEAAQSPRKIRSFKRYICNWWVAEVEDAWLDVDAWDKCEGPMVPAEEVYLSLDLSSVNDLTAICQGWDDEEEDLIYLKWWYFCPKERLRELEDKTRQPFRDWVDQGHIIATPGKSVNYAYVRQVISGVTADSDERADSIFTEHTVNELVYDPWNSAKLVRELEEDGIECLEHRQGFASMTGPSKEFERRILERKLRHKGDPVTRWQIQNAVVDQDPAGNIKPNKKKSRQKIDGVVTGVMVTGRVNEGRVEQGSFYDDNELEIF